jgi:predicted alpha/beta hydrolase family esterase
MSSSLLIVPGLGDSGPRHWQSWLHDIASPCARVVQKDWHSPDLDEWAERVRQAAHPMNGEAIVVAHSFGCLASARAILKNPGCVRAALLVAPADPALFGIDDGVVGASLNCPATVVASHDDPWIAFDRARELSELWRSEFVDAGYVGHINAEAGFGPWPDVMLHISRLIWRAGGFAPAVEKRIPAAFSARG